MTSFSNGIFEIDLEIRLRDTKLEHSKWKRTHIRKLKN